MARAQRLQAQQLAGRPTIQWRSFKPARPALGLGADTDVQLVELWLHGRAAHTQRAYRREVDRFLVFVARPLRAVTLADVQAFSDSLEHLAPSSRARAIAAIKSLLGWAHRAGYLLLNVGAAVKLPKRKDTLAERILDPLQVQELIARERKLRNQTLLLVTYAAGLRASEVCALRWRDLAARDDAGQLTIFGKGGKTRVVLLPSSVWRKLEQLRQAWTSPDAAVFASQMGGGPLDRSSVDRIVRGAAVRAGLGDQVSPHWLRHAHATHALERGAPIHLVQATLGHASVATTGRYLHARPTDSSARFLGL